MAVATEATDRHIAEQFIDHAARLLQLPIDPAHRASVLLEFNLLMGHARHLMGHDADRHTEAAPVFLA